MTEILGISAAALSVLGAIIAIVRYVRRQMSSLAGRIAGLEEKLAVYPTAVLRQAVVTDSGWLEKGTEVSVREIEGAVALVRIRRWGVEVAVPVIALDTTPAS
jgi:hypothetical protein